MGARIAHILAADAQARIDAVYASDTCRMMNADCDPMLGAADDNFNKHQTIQNLGLVALGVAAAVAAVGAALVVTGDDPDRYDRAPRTPDTRDLALSGWVEPGRGGIAVGGAF